MSWPTKKLGEVLEKNGVIPAKIKRDEYQVKGKYPVVDQGENLIAGYIDDEQKLYRGDLPVVIFGDHTRILKYIDFPFAFGADGIKILRPQKVLLPKFVYYTLILNPVANQGYKRHYSFLAQTKIFLPPLITQKQIVERLDKIAEAQKLNDELIQKTNELFQSLLHKELNPAAPADAKAMAGKKNWEITTIGEVCKIIGGGTPSREELKHFKGDIPWVTVKDLNVLEIKDTLEHINKESLKNSAANLVPAGTILVVTRVGLGKMAIAKKSLTFNQDIKGLIANAEIDASYLFYSILNKTDKIIRNGKGATVKGITQEFLKSIKIFFPPLKIQKQIVAKLSAVQDYKKQLLEQKLKLRELFDSALHKSFTN